MSIIINGMKMPKENDYTIVIVYGDGVVTEYHEDYWIRRADCEKQIGNAISVLPHGRLIDADALTEQIRMKADVTCGWADALDIALAPTTIEAERKE